MANRKGQNGQQNNNDDGKSRYDLPNNIFSGIARRFDERAVKSEGFALAWAPATALAYGARGLAEAGRYFEAADRMWQAVSAANELELPELLAEAKAEIEAAKAWLPEVATVAERKLATARDETQKIGARVQAARAALKLARDARFGARRAEAEALAKATTLAGAAGATVEFRTDRRCTSNNGVRPVVTMLPATKPGGSGQGASEASKKAKAEQAEALKLAMATVSQTGADGPARPRVSTRFGKSTTPLRSGVGRSRKATAKRKARTRSRAVAQKTPP